MTAYVIYNRLEVTDPEGLEEYQSKIRTLLADFGGRVIAAEAEPKILEGAWSGDRTVIIEFPDLESVERWHASDEYKPLLEIRQAASRGNAIALNGI